ncbi:MAG: NAD(P)/FAD-dependent oxidoreductase [Microthrixaceae bacterium]
MTDHHEGEGPRVAVLGGGPGGLMAAEVLAGAGVRVTIHDAAPSVGRKFLLAGRGGLNLTHSEPLGPFLDRYGPSAGRLRDAIQQYTPDDLRAWSAGLGEPTFIGSSGRVFPESFRANRLLEAWLERLDDLGVELRTGRRWVGWTDDGSVVLSGPDGDEDVDAAAAILSLGGASWPATGSDGSWVQHMTAAGIDVTPLRPANSGVDVVWTPVFAERFAGTPIKNVGLRCGDAWTRGELMVTEHGLEGGAVYALSQPVHDQIDRGPNTVLHVDLLPDLDHDAVLARLGRRRAKDSRSTVLRRHVGLAPVAVGLLREATDNVLPVDDHAVVELVKDVPVRVTGSAPMERAISTAGGVSWDEVDEHFMLRRRPGTYVVGEMLDWEAPTGGYLLQATFSTAVVAARDVLARLGRSAPHGAQHDELG